MDRKKLEKSIIYLKRPKPDFLIEDYKSFLKIRDVLSYYQFTANIFNSLLSLTLRLWQSNQRISRINLIQAISNYYRDKISTSRANNIEKLNSDSRNLLFKLFVTAIEYPNFVTDRQINEIQHTTYRLLNRIDLTEEQLAWLCENYKKSSFYYRKIINHHIKSPTISKWALKQYYTGLARGHRSKFAGWILNENPDFVITYLDLIADVRFFNQQDIEFSFDKMLNQDTVRERSSRLFGVPVLANRFIPGIMLFQDRIVDDDNTISAQLKVDTNFLFDNIDISQKYAMLWAVIFSRQNETEKSRQIINCYAIELHDIFVKLCVQQGLSEPLKWLFKLSDKKYDTFKKRTIPVFNDERKLLLEELERLTLKKIS